jgi:hypothetical protein
MIDEKFGMNELEKARQLQKDAVALHLPSPPVLSWKAEVYNLDGIKTVQIESKANSYTRNALNLLAHHLGFAYSPDRITFGDAYVSWKNTSGAMLNYQSVGVKADTSNGSPSQYFDIVSGMSDTAETIDSYVIENSPLTSLGYATRFTSFDSTTRKLITYIMKNFRNNTASDVNISEIGITAQMTVVGVAITGQTFLLVRDVVASPIVVPVGSTLNLSYQTEVLYPA